MDDKTTFSYSPNGSEAPDLDEVASPSEVEKPNEVVSWTASEYIEHHKGISWYLLLIISASCVSALIYYLTKSLFSALIPLLLAIIVGIFASRKPQVVTYELDNEGITIKGRHYPYQDFRSFTLIQETAIPSISLSPIKRIMVPLSLYYSPEHEQQIVKKLGDYLPFQRGQLDLTERLARKLRF